MLCPDPADARWCRRECWCTIGAQQSIGGHMSDNNPTKTFWIISGVALLWNLMGLWAFYGQMTLTPADFASMPADSRALYESMPSWVAVAFGVAVIAGVAGCILLLMRKALAVPVLIASLVGVLAQNAHSFFLSNTFEVLGNEAMVLPILVIVIAIALVLFARWANGKGWLN